MNLAYLRLSEDLPQHEEIPGHVVTAFSDVESLVEWSGPWEAVLLGCHDARLAEEAIRKIRSSPKGVLAPIVTLNDLGHRIRLLSDGTGPDIAAAVADLEAIVDRMRDIPGEVLDQGQDFRLLGYLYCRPDQLLTTDRQWHHEHVHSYPLAQVLADPGTTVERWLSNLVDRRYLDRAELLDRLRLCPKCSGRHHNFVDACPQNRSIDIVQKPFLHCFTCGHVAPEESFLASGALVCPNCAARLRHIGTDYDRPLENYACNECGHTFIEPIVIARCLSCGAENDPDALIPSHVYSFKLGERGLIAARTGSLEDIYALFDNLNYIRPQFFETLVDWLMALCRRYPQEFFSLLGIRLSNVLELTDRIGRYRTSELVDEFAVRLRDAIRKTDLTTRTSQRTLWILLPKTDRPGCGVLASRIRNIQEHTRQEEGVQIEIEIVTFSAPMDMAPDEPARLMLPRLMGDLD